MSEEKETAIKALKDLKLWMSKYGTYIRSATYDNETNVGIDLRLGIDMPQDCLDFASYIDSNSLSERIDILEGLKGGGL